MNNETYITKREQLCSVLVDKVKDYYKDESNRKKFEAWYYEKYHKEYQWH